MAPQYTKNLDHPDERIELNGAVDEFVTLGDLTVGRATQGVGWRWSRDWQHVVGGDACEAHHIGINLSGRQGILLRDGTTFEIGPGDVYDIPAGHDGWTIGDEPAVAIEWSGSRTWIAPRTGFHDRVLLALLFSDLVESTSTAERVGDSRWRDLMATHLASVRSIVEAGRGREVATTGDGILATFDGPARAIRAAAGIRRAALAQGLHVRVGVHVGEVEVIGDDVRGVAVHAAARIMAAAGPDEILVSELTKTLTTSAGLAFEDRGSHALKGLAGEHRLYAIREDAPVRP